MNSSNYDTRQLVRIGVISSGVLFGVWLFSRIGFGVQCFALGVGVTSICVCGMVGWGMYYMTRRKLENGH